MERDQCCVSRCVFSLLDLEKEGELFSMNVIEMCIQHLYLSKAMVTSLFFVDTEQFRMAGSLVKKLGDDWNRTWGLSSTRPLF